MGLIFFLASDAAGWITGETISIDGGRHRPAHGDERLDVLLDRFDESQALAFGKQPGGDKPDAAERADRIEGRRQRCGD